MERILRPTGARSAYTPYDREMFFDAITKNLYMYHGGVWKLIGGKLKQNEFIGENIEIVDIPGQENQAVRVTDDIDIDTMTLGKWYEQKTISDERGISSTVYFILTDKQHIAFSNGTTSIPFTFLDIENSANLYEGSPQGNAWYEISLGDFRNLTEIPETGTGSNLDLFDNNSYVYFDVYVDDANHLFSIDRVFVTHNQCTNEDDIISEGRVWVHNPTWFTPRDEHTIDVSDGFNLMSNIFQDTTENEPFTPNQPIKIMDIYKVIPGGILSTEIIPNPYPRWKGMIKLGEVENSTFFPLIKYAEEYPTGLIGGKFLVKTYRDNKIEHSTYHAMITASGRGTIFGSDQTNSKHTLNKVSFRDGDTQIGFRTYLTEKINYTGSNTTQITTTPPEKIEVWFNGWLIRPDSLLPSFDFLEGNIVSSKVVSRG